MLAAAPWSLAVFTLSLPFALADTPLYQLTDLVFVALTLINLIAFARMTFAWHRAVVLGNIPRDTTARGGTAEAKHLVLLAALAIAVAALGRATGDLPFVVYVLLNGAEDIRFWGALIASTAIIWLPVLYALATYGLSLPRVATTGEYGFGHIRAAMPYPRWPLMLMLLALVVVAGFTASVLSPLTYTFVTGADVAYAALGVVLSVLATFVVTAMYAVAYRDATGRAGESA